MVHIQQRALGAFKQQVGTGFVGVIQFPRYICHHGAQCLCVAHRFCICSIKINSRCVKEGRQNVVVQAQQFAQLGSETLRVFQVLHAQGAAGNFVFVGRANAFASGADLLGTPLLTQCLACSVECGVKRQDQRAGFADTQT